MGVGFKKCADELEAALAAAPASSPPREGEHEEKELARGGTTGGL